MPARDRDERGRPRNARPRDQLGRPLPRRDLTADGPTGNPSDPPSRPAEPGPAVALREAQALLDAGLPFEAHEVLEDVWKRTSGSRRGMWRALAQLCVGVTHRLRGNEAGAASLLRRAAEGLRPYAGQKPDTVEVDELVRWALTASRDPAATRPPRLVTPS